MSKNHKKTKTPEISTHLIVKNEMENLPLLIEDLKQFSDEIIVVDTGSTDGTLEWLNENKNEVLKVYEFEWINNFSAARNFALSKVTKSWVFWCDADDRISIELINLLNEIKPNLNNSEFNAYAMIYQYTPTFTQHRHRLFKMSDKPEWQCVCHECIGCKDMKSVILPDECKVIHQREHGKTDRNIEIFDKYIAAGNELTSREMLCFAHEINFAPGRKKEAEEYALKALFMDDVWDVLGWESLVDVLGSSWTLEKEKAHVGIAIIDRFEALHGRLRGDVYYLRACLHDNVGEYNESLKDCYNAINTVMVGLETYNENIHFSKILPAMSIYNTVTDDFTRNRMVEILKLYQDIEFVRNFLVEKGVIKETTIDIGEFVPDPA